MKFPLSVPHEISPSPDASLTLYQVSFDENQISEVYLPLAQAYWQDPTGHAVPDQQASGSTDWGKHDMRVMFCCGARKFCNDQVRKKVGDSLTENIQYLTTVACPTLGIESREFTHARNLTQLYEDWADALWEKYSEVLDNPGVAIFMQESGGLLPRSVHTPAIFLTGSPDAHIECAYGYGLDLCGNYSRILPSDPLSICVPKKDLHSGDRGFIYERDRSQSIVRSFKRAKKIVALDAGWLPEVRHAEIFYGPISPNANEENAVTRPNWQGKKLLAFGRGKAIPDELVGSWATEERMSVLYRKMTYRQTLDYLTLSTAPRSFDLVYAKNTFTRNPELLEETMQTVMPLLKSGGEFMFDMILDHPVARRELLLFGNGARLVHGEFRFMEEDEAIDFVDLAIHHVAEKLHTTFNWSCEIDQQNDPLGLMFKISRT